MHRHAHSADIGLIGLAVMGQVSATWVCERKRILACLHINHRRHHRLSAEPDP